MRTRDVAWMLAALSDQPWSTAAYYLVYLDALGGKTLAVKKLNAIAESTTDPDRMQGAREVRRRWDSDQPMTGG